MFVVMGTHLSCNLKDAAKVMGGNYTEAELKQAMARVSGDPIRFKIIDGEWYLACQDLDRIIVYLILESSKNMCHGHSFKLPPNYYGTKLEYMREIMGADEDADADCSGF